MGLFVNSKNIPKRQTRRANAQTTHIQVQNWKIYTQLTQSILCPIFLVHVIPILRLNYNLQNQGKLTSLLFFCMTYLKLSQEDIKSSVHLIDNGGEEKVVLILLLGNRAEVSNSVHQWQVFHHHGHDMLLQHVWLQHISGAQIKQQRLTTCYATHTKLS